MFDKYLIPLQDKHGLKLFCDMDFKNHARENWSDQMEENLRDAKLCILFVSKDYVCSYACLLETYMAIITSKPILKIQVGVPEKSKDKTEKTLSEATKDHFLYISNMLDSLNRNDPRVRYKEYFLLLEKYLRRGKIGIDRLSEQFAKCIKALPGTSISINDGVDAVINSINDAIEEEYDEEINIWGPVDNVSESGQHAMDEKKESPERKSPKEAGAKDKSYTIFGDKRTGNQTRMMVDALDAVIKRNFDKLDLIAEKLSSVELAPIQQLRDDDNTYFRTGEELTYQGRTYSIGTAYNREAKLAQIRKAIELTGEDTDAFEIDGLFLGGKTDNTEDKSQKRTGRTGTDMRYMIFGKEYTGNQSKMMYDVFESLVNRAPDMIDKLATIQCVEQMENVTDAGTKAAKPSYFRACKQFDIGGHGYYVGTSYNYDTKVRQIGEMLRVCGVDKGELKILD